MTVSGGDNGQWKPQRFDFQPKVKISPIKT
jgi:hypothetical protein